jgi:WD40 repeat protein
MDAIEQIIEAIRPLIRQHRTRELKDIEYFVLRGSLEGLTYKEISRSQNRSFTASSLKQAGSELWDCLSEVLSAEFDEDIRVKKSNCQDSLRRWLLHQSGLISQPPLSEEPEDEKPPVSYRFRVMNRDDTDLGIDDLLAQIRAEGLLLLLNGFSGSGKTMLLRTLLEQAPQDFDLKVQLRAEDVPRPQDLYEQLRQERDARLPSSPNSTRQGVQGLLALLRQHRWLIVIDRTEELYQPGELAGSLKAESAEYEQWLERLSDEKHRSCILWVGREQSNFLRAINTIALNGLSFTDAQRFVQQSLDWEGTEELWQHLYDLCSGVPRLMRMVAEWIAEHHHQSVTLARALQPLPERIRIELQAVLARLSSSEQALATWLLIQPIAYSNLENFVRSDLLLRDLHQAWDSLDRRGLRHKTANDSALYQLHPPLFRFIVEEQFAVAFVEEFVTVQPERLLHYPLLQPTYFSVEDAQLQSQLLTLVTEFLEQRDLTPEGLQETFMGNLNNLRNYNQASRYGAGNLINLAVFLGLPLTNWDFSDLPILHADLRQAKLNGTHFRDCIFRDSIFPEGLTDDFKIALSAKGTHFAVGDRSGRVLVWQRTANQITLIDSFRIESSIQALAFAVDNTLVIASAQAVYVRWGAELGVDLQPTFQLDAQIHCLDVSTNGEMLAIGLETGQIAICNILSDEPPQTLPGSIGDVQTLVFSPDNKWIASCNASNQIWKWNITETHGSPTRFEVPFTARTSSILIQPLGWRNDQLLSIEVSSDLTELHQENQSVRSLANTEIIASTLSRNSCYLAGSSIDGSVLIWDLQSATWDLQSATKPLSFNVGNSTPIALALCAQGNILLASTRNKVQLWDVTHQRCFWETTAIPENASFIELDWRGTEGIPEINQAILQDLGVRL